MESTTSAGCEPRRTPHGRRRGHGGFLRWRAVVVVAVLSTSPVGTLSESSAGGDDSRQDSMAEADALYADRENPASVRRAIDIWNAALARHDGGLDAYWKLARARYWMGTHGPESRDDRRRQLQDGIASARQLIALAPTRPEGHFWLAANMGALAEGFGLREGLRYRRPIKEALETVLKIDAAYLQGSADRALGRWYAKVPGLFGGDRRRAEEHLRRSLGYAPNSIITHVFLAELYIDTNRNDDAKRHLDAALRAPIDLEWAPEDRRFQIRARELVARLGTSR